MSNLTVSAVSAPHAGMSMGSKGATLYFTSVTAYGYAFTYSPVEVYGRSVLTSAIASYTTVLPRPEGGGAVDGVCLFVFPIGFI